MAKNRHTKPAIVQSANFPNHLLTDSEKADEAYGLQVGQAIQYEWFRKRGGGGCKFYDQWSEFHNLRLYARGEQPIQKYKKLMKVNGDLSQLNLDWTNVPIVPKFRDIIVNGMSDRLFTPRAFAEDITSAEERDSYQQVIEKDMIAKEFLKQTQDEFGIDAFNVDPKNLPENDQELQLHMQLEFKPAIEIAAETGISTVLEMNDFPEVKYQYNKDQVELGIGIVKHEYLHNKGISIKSVDPQNTIHSYTEDIHFQDVFYWGEVDQVPIIELYKIDPDLSKEDINDIATRGSAWNEEYNVGNNYEDSLFEKDVVNLLYFNYKTTKTFVYKVKLLENGGRRIIEKDEEFNPGESEFFEKVTKTIDVWYEGVMVLGTDRILKWEIDKNMVRPGAAFQKVYPNYIAVAPDMYKGIINSKGNTL